MGRKLLLGCLLCWAQLFGWVSSLRVPTNHLGGGQDEAPTAMSRVFRDTITDAIVEGPGITDRNSYGKRRWFVIRAIGPDGPLKRSPLKLSRPAPPPTSYFGLPDIPIPFQVEVNQVLFPENITHKLHVDVLDRGDGSYLVLYASPKSCDGLRTSVQLEGVHVGGSPFVLQGPRGVRGWLRSDACDCPDPDGESWARSAQCDVDRDRETARSLLKVKSITRKDIDRMVSTKDKKALMHYTIKDNQIYSQPLGDLCAFQDFVDSMLVALARRTSLPDVEFVMNLGDWPRGEAENYGLPFVSWCGSNSTSDFVLPTWIQIKNLGGGAIEDHQMMDGLAYATGAGWENKDPVLFFRGRDSNERRVQLAMEARAAGRPDVDVAINEWSWRHRGQPVEHDLGRANRTRMADFFKHKYLLSIDGTVAAYRLAAVLAGDSCVFKQESEYYEHYYHELKPWQEYVPVAGDLKDWQTKLDWAKAHDAECRAISERARKYVRQRLRPTDIFCAYYFGLVEYASRQEFTPTVHENMTWVNPEAVGRLMSGSFPGKSLESSCACSTVRPPSSSGG